MLHVVELFGLPGSGKTTLIHAVKHRSNAMTVADLAAAWKQESILGRGSYLARGFLDLPLVKAAAELAIASPLASRESLFRLGRLAAKGHWIRSQPRGLLLDQGFLQDLWSIFYCAGCPEPPPAHLARLLRALYRGIEAHIFYLELDAGTASQRINGRSTGSSRFDKLPAAAVHGALFPAAGLPQAIVRAATEAGLHVETLPGSAGTAALSERLEPALPK